MKKLLIAGAAMLLMAQAAPTVRMDDLTWLSGHWATDRDGWLTEEYWSGPRGAIMIGYSRSVQRDRVAQWEFLRIEPGSDGVPVYWASPTGRPAVPFRLVASDPSSATFENPAHDYPQRIRYRREGDSLVATISLLDGSRALNWTYTRR